MADILQLEMNLPKNIPKDLSDLLEVMVTDFRHPPRELRWNLSLGVVDLRGLR